MSKLIPINESNKDGKMHLSWRLNPVQRTVQAVFGLRLVEGFMEGKKIR